MRPGIAWVGAMELRDSTALARTSRRDSGDRVCGELAARGAKVVGADVPGSGADLEADLATASGARVLAEAAGEVDLLVNNAGLEFIGAYTRHTAEELEAITRVNLLAPMELIRLLVGGMSERGKGHVVNMASLAGRVPTAWTSTYNATKHGLVGLTHALRAEYATTPIGFSVICPGFVSDAGMYGRHEDAVDVPAVLGTLPPSEVAEAVATAVEKDRAEIVVNPRPIKPMFALAAAAPAAAAKITERIGANETWRQVAERKGRL